ncbi:MAG: VOC family protein [Deltaproteobacteria bacterium]|nr:VOC family protein [Deltaproteobacteria bacterium]
MSRNPRVHVALNVTNLDESIAFYRTLLGTEPSKIQPDYAKFEPESPPVHLSLNPVAETTNETRVSHFGVQVWSAGELEVVRQRLGDAGLTLTPEDGVTCCYAVQDKVWVEDPDGNSWEVFLSKADAAVHSDRQAGPDFDCCPTTESKSCC